MPQLSSLTPSLISPLSSFYPRGPYPALLVTNTSLYPPHFLTRSSCQRPREQPIPPHTHTLGPGKEAEEGGFPRGKGREPETRSGQRAESLQLYGKVLGPGRCLFSWQSQTGQIPQRGSGSESD